MQKLLAIGIFGTLATESTAWHSNQQPACPENSTFESWSGECVCWAGFKKEHGKCVSVCPEGYELDYKYQQKCVKTCNEYNTYYDEYKDACVPCGKNSIWEPSWQECRCLGGFEKIHDKCVPICSAGTFRHGYSCVQNCPKHSSYEPKWKKCVCDKGYIGDKHGDCVPDCGEYEEYDHHAYKCVCKKGLERDDHNRCRPVCGKHEIWDEYKWECVCKDGFRRDYENHCVPECGKNAYFNHDTYACECRDGYKSDGHYGCIEKSQCPSNSTFESWSGKCVCWAGFKEENHKCVPVCPYGYELDYKYQKECVKQCHDFNTYYDKWEDKCVKCPANSLWEPSWQECRCLGGFEKAYDECLPTCPSGTRRNGYDCKKW